MVKRRDTTRQPGASGDVVKLTIEALLLLVFEVGGYTGKFDVAVAAGNECLASRVATQAVETPGGAGLHFKPWLRLVFSRRAGEGVKACS
jgi:hypothetical protein